MVQYILKLSIILLITAPFYLICRRPWTRISSGKQTVRREVELACFVLFHMGLLRLALEGEYGRPVYMACWAAERIATGEGINLIPFRTIGRFCTSIELDAFLVNIVGNIVMFMPWGFGIVLLWKKNRHVGKVLFYSFLLPLFIETMQLFIGRSVDIDDLILNFTGSCLGAIIFFLIKCHNNIRKVPTDQ